MSQGPDIFPSTPIEPMPIEEIMASAGPLHGTPITDGDREVAALLTDDEHAAMKLTGQLANLVRKIIGSGPQAEHDWAEAAHRIHSVQHMILAQAAARAYPDDYRPLGGWGA